MTERTTIRLGIPALLLGSTSGALAVSLHTATAEIPSFAFSSRAVLSVQLTLLFFYAALLLLVPLMRAIFSGDLPIELSLKGARWTEGIDDLGAKVSDSLAAAEETGCATDLEIKEEIRELRDLLNRFGGAHRSQELED